MSDSPQERKEECRRSVRAYLANRSVLAYRAETIRSALAREHDFSIEEIKAALVYLESDKHVAVTPDPDGATPYYRITSEGMRFNERNP